MYRPPVASPDQATPTVAVPPATALPGSSTLSELDASDALTTQLDSRCVIDAAPPYATVNLDGDATRLMGASTARVRQLYDMLGLTSPWENKIPDDHIAFELDALWQISQTLQSVVSPQLKDAQAYLHEHLRAWVPAFVERIRAAPDPHPAIVAVANALLKSVETTDAVGAY